jgi:colanic acid/amylovoran biosynthesis protein
MPARRHGAPSVLIVNAYSARNLGDGAIVQTMCRAFSERGARVCVMSDDPGDADRYGVPVHPSLLPVWKPRLRGIPGAAAEAALATRQTIRRPPRLLDDFDVMVSAGGGYLYDDGSAGSRRNLLRRLHTLRTAQRSGRPVIAFSQSVGPFASQTLGALTGRVLRRCAAVFVREQISLAECSALGIRHAQLADDIVFAASGRADDPDVAALLSQFRVAPIGATVIDWRFGGDERWERKQTAYVEALRGSLSEAARRFDRPVAIISQVDAHTGDSDTRLAKGLAARLSWECDARFLDVTDLSYEQLIGFYARLHVLVASRMHSGIFALAGGTPVVAVAYLPKTAGIMARAGFERFVTPIDQANADDLFRLLRSVEEERDELSRVLEKRLPALRSSALRAVEESLELGRSLSGHTSSESRVG